MGLLQCSVCFQGRSSLALPPHGAESDSSRCQTLKHPHQPQGAGENLWLWHQRLPGWLYCTDKGGWLPSIHGSKSDSLGLGFLHSPFTLCHEWLHHERGTTLFSTHLSTKITCTSSTVSVLSNVCNLFSACLFHLVESVTDWVLYTTWFQSGTYWWLEISEHTQLKPLDETRSAVAEDEDARKHQVRLHTTSNCSITILAISMLSLLA